MLRRFTWIILLLIPLALAGQKNVADSAVSVPMISANLGLQWPGGDLEERYGMSNSAGGSFLFKTSGNWLIGAEFNYIFSENIKDKDEILSLISTESGSIIDGNGMFTEVNYHERGFYTNLTFGKLFPVIGPNPNSGLFITGGVGLLQHRTFIQNPENRAPQISGEYMKGYDRLTNGLAVSEMFGYMHLGSKRLASFYIGVEFIQAWTQSRRDYNFNLMKKVNEKRFDMLYGVRVGWIIPLYGRSSGDYYYF